MKGAPAIDSRALALSSLLDSHAGHYRELGESNDFAQYVADGPSREDEEILTEPVLTEVLQSVLGFPVDAYFAQYGRGGLKPDLTPMDTVAHSFVLDAKSSLQDLAHHEPQIRSYIDQRQLDFGVLFNLRELRVYRRGRTGHDPSLSFSLLPVWRYARGESMAPPELATFLDFLEQFSFRELTTADRIAHVRGAEQWATREQSGAIEIDVDYLVENLRRLARVLAEDAHALGEVLEEAFSQGGRRYHWSFPLESSAKIHGPRIRNCWRRVSSRPRSSTE